MSGGVSFTDYDFGPGDRVVVDWSKGMGPRKEVTGIVEGIGRSAGEVVVSVVDYDDPAFANGRTYDAAPRWITVREPALPMPVRLRGVRT